MASKLYVPTKPKIISEKIILAKVGILWMDNVRYLLAQV